MRAASPAYPAEGQGAQASHNPMAVMAQAAMYRLARRVKRRTAQTPMALTIPSAGLMHSAAASGKPQQHQRADQAERRPAEQAEAVGALACEGEREGAAVAGGDAEGELAGVDTLGVSGSLSRLACRPGLNAWVVMSRRSWSAGAKVAPRVYRGARYVTVSEASKSDLVALGVRDRDIAIVENGVDPIPDELPVVPDDGKVHVVTLSRLVPHKRIEHAIDAIAGRDDVVLDILGSGWWEDKLREYAAGRAEIRFHGHVNDAYKHAILSRAALHLMPSAKEGWGIAVIEAAQHGVPTVGYRGAGGVNDSIIDGETGQLVDTKAEFVQAVEQLLVDAPLRRRLGAAAQARAEKYSWAATGEKFAAVLRSVVGAKR